MPRAPALSPVQVKGLRLYGQAPGSFAHDKSTFLGRILKAQAVINGKHHKIWEPARPAFFPCLMPAIHKQQQAPCCQGRLKRPDQYSYF